MLQALTGGQDISRVLFIANEEPERLGLLCFCRSPAAHLFHLQRAPAGGGWKLHHLHQEFHQVSKVWVFQVSGCKYCWLLLCLRIQGTMTDHRESLDASVFWWLLEITLWCREPSIYTSMCVVVSETVIWDVLDSGPCTGQVSAQMGLVQSTALLSES